MQPEIIPMVGGFDLASPALQIEPGRLIACENYECSLEGYRRIDGWERFDGQPKPSEATAYTLTFDGGTVEPSVGDFIEGATSGASGFLLELTVTSGDWGTNDAAGTMILRSVTGIFTDDENLQVSAVTQAVANGTATTPSGDDDTAQANYLAAARASARALIQAVPGEGPVRGAYIYMGDTYAFRDNVGATQGVMHKATSSGWVAQSFGRVIDFTSGSTEPTEGDTITGATSGATATIERVVLQSGEWTGDAAGYLVLSSQTGTFQAENINNTTAASNDVMSIGGDSSEVTLPPGGLYDFTDHNFFGASNLRRLYFTNGVGYAHEWDGTVLAPIRTGVEANLDTPTYIGVVSDHLALAYNGGHINISGIQKPLSFLVIDGATTKSLGQDITGLVAATKTSLVITARKKISYLTGTSAADFLLQEYSDKSGAVSRTLAVLNEPIFLDDAGVRELSASEAFGNWTMGTLSKSVEKLILNNRKNGIGVVGSIVVQEKDQYRLFYADGSILSLYFGRGNVEIARSMLDFTPTCLFQGQDQNGNEVLYAGADDGFLYQLDSGTSADGDQITAYIRLAFVHFNSPNMEKRFGRGRLEVAAGSGPATIGTLAQTGYGDTNLPEQDEQSHTFYGGGGFWDQFLWDDFYWSAPVLATFLLYFDMIGSNISVVIVSDLTEEEPHTLSALTIYYSPRRMIK